MISLTKSFQQLSSHYIKNVVLVFLLVAQIAIAQGSIRISGLQEIKFGIWTIGSGTLFSSNDICVAVDQPGPYQITAAGIGSGNDFYLSSGGNNIVYLVFFNDAPRLSGRQQLSPGVPLTGLKGKKRKKKADCNKPTANLSLEIPESNISAAPAGHYSGVLVLLVSPE